MKFYKAPIILCFLIVLGGCIHTQQLEYLGIMLTRGIDKKDDELEVNMSVLQFQKDAPSATRTISGTGKTIKGAVQNANERFNQQLVNGKLELEIYDKEIAEEGLNPLLDTLRRDANVPSTVLLAVSETKTKELFQVQEEKIGTSLGEFLHEVIEPGMERRLFPAVTLARFIYMMDNPGIEPVLPIMDLKDGIPTLTGIALFKRDKMVGKLPYEYALLFQMIQGTARDDELYEITLPAKAVQPYLNNKDEAEEKENIHLTFLIERGTGYAVLINKEQLKYETYVNIELSLLETSMSYKLQEEEAIHHLEKEIEKHIKEQYEKILAKQKELNVDSFGYGIFYRIKNKGGKLKEEEWNELFPQIDVTFNIHTEIIRHGETHR